jgi:hypothetical protein
MFIETNMASFSNQNYTQPINAFTSGLSKIRIIMNNQDRRNVI